MSSKNKKQITFEHLEVTGVASKGRGVSRCPDGKVLFVSNVVPEDIITAKVYKKRRSYYEGEVEEFHHLSKKRTSPKCSHFGVCGGCKWQMMDYQYQLEYKAQEVQENLKRIAKVALPQINQIIASDEIYHYRNKMEFSFSNRRWLTSEEILDKTHTPDRTALGLHISGRWDKVLDIDRCYLHAEETESIRMAIKTFANEKGLSFYDAREQKGLLRNLTLRRSSTGQIMVLLHFFEDDLSRRTLILEFLKKTFPEINSLQYVVNQKQNDTIYDLDVHCYYGKPYITESMGELQFRIGAKSFYQTNSLQAHKLYKKILEFSELTKEDLVYDLYTGTGTIALFIAKLVSRVIAIESVPESIEDAKINAQYNGIKNIDFFVGDMRDVFSSDFIRSNGIPDVVLTDPPRDGMHRKVVQQLIEVAPKRIVYVSCNTATQARDIELLSKSYRVTKVQPVDMFPQTYHVENIVLLEKRIL